MQINEPERTAAALWIYGSKVIPDMQKVFKTTALAGSMMALIVAVTVGCVLCIEGLKLLRKKKKWIKNPQDMLIVYNNLEPDMKNWY